MSTSKTINYDSNDQNRFIHNDTQVLIDSNGATFKPLTLQSEEMMVATGKLGADADRGSSTLVATPSGSALLTTVSSNQYYDVSGNISGKAWRFDGANANMGTKGTIRFKLIPKYDNAPLSNAFMILAEGVATANNITMFHQTTGNVQIRMNSSTGAASNQDFAGWFVNVNQEYEVEFNFDLTQSNSVRLFIDGVQLSTTKNVVMTRTEITDFWLGSSAGASEYLIRDLEIFNTPQHIADFAGEVPRVVPILPAESFIEPQDFSLAEGFDSLTENRVLFGNANVKYALKIENQFYWNLGDVLTVSDKSYLESNVASGWLTVGIIAAINAFISTGARITFCPVLYSGPAGEDNLNVISNTLEYDFFALPVSCDQCTVYGFVTDNCTDISSGTARFYVKSPQIAQGQNVTFDDTVSMDIANGFYEYPIVIPDVATPYPCFVDLEWTDIDGDDWAVTYELDVPDAASGNVVNIRVEE